VETGASLLHFQRAPSAFSESSLMSGHIFKIGLANQANPKMQNNGGPQHRDQPVSGLHFSARHFSACLGSCSVFL
jgi:hypothetical protein